MLKKLSGKERKFTLSEVGKVVVNEYGRIQIRNRQGKLLFVTNIFEYPGVMELVLLLHKKGVKFVYNAKEMTDNFISELEKYYLENTAKEKSWSESLK